MSERSPQPASLQRWRIEVLDTVTRVSFYIALPLLVLSSIISITDGNVTAFVIGVFSIAFVAAITFVRSINPSIRSIVLIALPYTVGTYWLVISGLTGTGQIYLVFVAVVAALLFRKRIAILLSAISVVTMGVILIGFHTGIIPVPFTILERAFTPPTLAASWVAQALISVASALAVVITVDTVRSSTIRAEESAAQLRKLNAELEDRVQAQTEEIREQARFLERTQRAGQIGSFRADVTANRWTSSATLDELFGIDHDYVRTVDGWLQIVHHQDREMMRSYLDDVVIAGRNTFSKEYRIERVDTGETRWVYEYGDLEYDDDGVITGIYGTIQDMTVRKQAELNLKESEEKFRTLVENTTDGLVVFGPNQRIRYASPSFNRMHGYTEDFVLGWGADEIAQLVHPEDWDRTVRSLYQAIENRLPDLSYEFRVKCQDGSYIWRHDRARMVYDDEGHYAGSYVVCTDITERKQMELELEMFHRFVEHSPLGIAFSDTHGTIEYINPGFTTMYGYEKDEVIGRSFDILKSGYHDDDFYRAMWETLSSGAIWRGEIRNKGKDGSTNWILAVISPMLDYNGTVTHFIFYSGGYYRQKGDGAFTGKY